MAVFLIKFFLSTLSSFADFLSYVIFNVAAYVLVLAIRGLRVPGIGIKTLFEYAADTVKEAIGYLIELIVDAISSLISDVFALLLEAITGSVSFTAAAVGDLMGKTKMSLEELAKVLPELLADASETVWTIITAIWNNSKDAVGYVLENI